MKMFSSKNIHIVLLLCILAGALLARLYRFDGPIADWHSWRQADTSSVSRNFVKYGFDVLHPIFDDLSNVASGKDNPHGYRFVEFPLYNVLQALPAKYIGVLTLEEWGRLVTIFSSLGSITFLYLLIKRYVGDTAGLFTAFFYAFLPYNIYYGRVILPDPATVTAFLGAIYFFDRWAEFESRIKPFDSAQGKNKQSSKWLYFILALGFATCSLLLKPYAAFFLLPIGVISLQKFGIRVFLQWKLWIFAALAIAPLIGWRLWMQQFPEGIPANNWLLNGNGIRFRPAFFRWIGYERVIKLISGYTGILIMIPGIIYIFQKRSLILISFLCSSFLYVTIFATGNVQHDYYQIMIMPSIAICYGVGLWFLLRLGNIFSLRKGKRITFKQYILLVAVILIMIYAFNFSWKQVKDYFNVNNPSIVTAGEFVDKHTPKDAKVIAIYTGDTSFLYQTNRQGWASFTYEVEELKSRGADYLVFASPVKADYYFAKEYKVIAESKDYLLYDLHKKL